MPAIIVDVHGTEEIAAAAPLEQVLGVVGHRHFGEQVIGEDEQALIARPEAGGPASEAIDVFLLGPAFPDAATLFGWASGKATALDVNHEPGAVRAMNDEVETLYRSVAKHGASRFIDGNIAELLLL
jgi:hypothetical protein